MMVECVHCLDRGIYQSKACSYCQKGLQLKITFGPGRIVFCPEGVSRQDYEEYKYFLEFRYTLPIRKPEPDEYVGPFDSDQELVEFAETWGGIHGDSVLLKKTPVNCYSPEDIKARQECRGL